MDNKTNKHEFACNAGKVTEYEVKEHIDTIMVGFRGFSKEVSIVKWNDKNPVFDIRAWRVSDRDGLQYPLRGITFSKEEFIKLREKYAMDMEDKLKYGYDFNAEKMSFEDFAYKWLESVKDNIAYGTYAGYKQALESRIIPYFKGYKVAHIKTPYIEAFYRTLVDDYATGTIKRYAEQFGEMYFDL